MPRTLVIDATTRGRARRVAERSARPTASSIPSASASAALTAADDADEARAAAGAGAGTEVR